MGSMRAPSLRLRYALRAGSALALVGGYVLLYWVVSNFAFLFEMTLPLALAVSLGTAALPLVFAGRVVARARLRATGTDPLAALRRWALARPRALLALLSAPAVLAWAVSAFATDPFSWSWLGARSALTVMSVLCLWILPSIASVLVARAGLRRLLLPLVDDADRERASAGAEGFTFSAVAVGWETRAMVGGFTAACAAAVALVAAAPAHVLFSPVFGAAMLASIAGAAGATFAFQRASRIALGVDGVLVTGTSRTRFLAYRDVDDVDVTRSGDVLLRRHGRVALRLQLHGDDQGKHVAIAERIRQSIAGAAELGGGGAHRLAEAATFAPLARAARGQSDYRAPGATREELWQLVEATATAGPARVAAGEALALEADRADRARLRIAAEHCAEPSTRAALSRIAATVEPDEDEEDAAAAIPRVLRMNGGEPGRRPEPSS
jgi:hypothetical protein